MNALRANRSGEAAQPRGDRRKGAEARAKPADGSEGAPRQDRGPFKGNRNEGERKGGDRPSRKDGSERKGGDRSTSKRDDFKPKSFESRPEKPIDPDNPFAALMALKSKL
ncbi:MAG: hypothetical protein U5N55_07300 [Cypionkella sp.]|nr:hypothetical protein [Cypionkella sp.]